MTIDGKIGLPSNPRPKLNKIQNGVLPSPLLNPKEEVTFRASRSISRTAKPPSLHLQRSNGSTAASISSVSTNASDSPLGPSKPSPPPIPPFSKARNSRDKQQQFSRGVSDVTPARTSDVRTAYDNFLSRTPPNRKPLPEVKSPHDDRPLPSLPASAPPQEKSLPPINDVAKGDDTGYDTVAVSNEHVDVPAADMKRFKDLVKRKPVRSDSNAMLSPSTSAPVNKENKPFHSSPTLGSFFGNVATLSHANNTDSLNMETSEPTSKTNSNQNTNVTSPADSHSQLSSRNPQASATASQETIIAGFRQPSLEDGIEGAPQTPRLPPALLPQASPVSQLAESPSNYAVNLHSNTDLQASNDMSVRNSARIRVVSGIAEYKVSLPGRISSLTVTNLKQVFDTLKAHVAGTQDGDEESFQNPELIRANEAARDIFLHPSYIHLTRPRPLGSNASKIGTVQLHCFTNHPKWHESYNDPVSQVDCTLCYSSGQSTRYTCSFCALRVCAGCKESIVAEKRGHPLQQIIDASVAESVSLREQKLARDRARRELASRPSSPAGSVYDAGEMDPPYRSQNGSQSIRSIRSTGNMRNNGPFYGGPGYNQGVAGAMRQQQTGGRRFSQGNVLAPSDYPPPPRVMGPNTPTSPRGRSPTSIGPQRGGRGYPSENYQSYPPATQPRSNFRLQQGSYNYGGGPYNPGGGPSFGGGGFNNGAGVGYNSSGQSYNGRSPNYPPPPRAQNGAATTARRERRGQDTMRDVYIG
jgi:hypothetical protein